MVISLLHAV